MRSETLIRSSISMSQTLKTVALYLAAFCTFVISFKSNSAQAANNSTDLMCRNKAKEIAAETYKNCVTDVRQTQVKSLRKDYEEKLNALKNYYDQELKKISRGEAPTSATPQHKQVQPDAAPLEILPIEEIQQQENQTSPSTTSLNLRSSDDNLLIQEEVTLRKMPPSTASSSAKKSTKSVQINKKPTVHQANITQNLKNDTDLSSVEVVEFPPERE
ncbi:MAG: hypothetical protein ACK41T_03120 [Pseudobdellovibrio sp.]